MPGSHLTRIVALAALLLRTAAAQDAFDVVSVKPNDGDHPPYVAWRTYAGGRTEITGYTLHMLIARAYGVSEYGIAGGPQWVRWDFFNVTAKPAAGTVAAGFMPDKPNSPPSPELLGMMRTLLADRFGLKFHRETREEKVLALVVDNGGTKLKPASDPSAEPKYSQESGELIGRNVNLGYLVALLDRHVNGVVVDHTGLTGRYDFNLKYSDNGADGLPLDVAIEKLGLKLKPVKISSEFLVIDDVKKPESN